MQNDGIESLHSDWQPLEQIGRMSLLLELRRDPAPQLSKEVNSRFTDRSQCLQRSAEIRMRLGDQSIWLPFCKLQPKLQQLQWRKTLGRRSLPTLLVSYYYYYYYYGWSTMTTTSSLFVLGPCLSLKTVHFSFLVKFKCSISNLLYSSTEFLEFNDQ